MVRKHSTYTNAHKRYYDIRIKPKRERKVGIDICSCPFCGMMNNLVRLRDPQLHLKKRYVREGCNWFDPKEYSIIYHNPELEIYYFQRWESFMRDTCDKTFKFLKWALVQGLITKDRIILEFELEIVQKAQQLEDAKPITNFIFSAIRGSSSPGESQDLEESSLLENSKSIKSAGGISNG